MTRAQVGAALVAGLLVRLALLFLVDHSRFPAGDEVGYVTLARNLVEQGVFSLDSAPPYPPTVARAPLYPVFLAAHFALFGYAPAWVRLSQALIGLLTAWVVARTIAACSPRAGPLALWAGMLCPLSAVYHSAFLTEILCGFWLASSSALLVLGRSARAHLAAGLLLGAAILTRDVYGPLLVLGPVALLVLKRRSAGAWRCAAALALGAVLIILPWSMRNLLVAHQTVLIGQGGLGWNLWIGTWERDATWMGPPRRYPDYAFRNREDRLLVAELDRCGDLSRWDQGYRRLARERYAENPLGAIAASLRRYPKLWLGTRTQLFSLRLSPGGWPWMLLKSAFYAWNLVVVTLGAVGLVLVWRRGLPLALLGVPIVYNGLLYLPLHSTETRYTQPVYPLLLGLAAFAAVALADSLGGRKGALAWPFTRRAP